MKAWPWGGPFPTVLAHQGGWDEVLLIVGPLVVVGGALWIANKRAGRLEAADPAPDDDK